MSDPTGAVADELAARRARSNLTCPCGSQWWRVEAVVLAADDGTPDLRVTGHTLPLWCIDCGAEYVPPPERL